MTLWHVAFATRVDAILRNGIVPEGTPRVVFAFTDHGDATRWAGWMQWAASSTDDFPRLVVIVEFGADPEVWEVVSDRTLDVLRSRVVLRMAVCRRPRSVTWMFSSRRWSAGWRREGHGAAG